MALQILPLQQVNARTTDNPALLDAKLSSNAMVSEPEGTTLLLPSPPPNLSLFSSHLFGIRSGSFI
jgi:hypothetical protein